MAQTAGKFLALVDEKTGAVDPVPRAPYAFDGPHTNVGIRRGRQLAAGLSGLTDRQYRVLMWYAFATEEAEGAVEMTQVDIADELKMTPDALSRTVKVLRAHRLLLEDGGVGRTKFYRATPYIHFIGSGFEHREAVKNWNPPELPVQQARKPAAKKAAAPKKKATKKEAAE